MNRKSLLLLALVSACTATPIENGSNTDPNGDLRFYSQVSSVVISPDPVTLAAKQIQQFNARVTFRSGTVQNNPWWLAWTATGGTVTSGGRYTAGSATGVFRVKAAVPFGVRDSVLITIIGSAAPATIVQVTVAPDTATIRTAATLQLTATAKRSDNTTATPALTWTASLGSVSASGLFTAPASDGVATVTGVSANGKSDTSRVTVTMDTVAGPPPTVTAVVVTPATASLASGATQQFAASAALSNGTTQSNPTVTWTATGGTVTTGGLYTAGGTAGTFRVIGTSSSGPADTSAVTITAPAPMVTAIGESGVGLDRRPRLSGERRFSVAESLEHLDLESGAQRDGPLPRLSGDLYLARLSAPEPECLPVVLDLPVSRPVPDGQLRPMAGERILRDASLPR